ncbi:phytoene desaturase family protein [Humisphaera borealis]|uniref:NAD(P)/FAD-dependent oxidoreductase n=1 Tax=Humisphaera borealis TaxID=2807512 RepID=A0A7M2WZU4_9BACT|nr:NAD(P)/FAD-dependent oxidoreductase [Humisphaera borealis]QOV90722.1 NAD(P)/FAD-dependent oxidoreductase [Humisphaera borealis]
MTSTTAKSYDAIVIGSGPNGLGAAIELARNGKSVIVYEAADTVGGGMRSAELTLPGFVHDHCSTVQALCLASPLFSSLPLSDYGMELVHPEIPVAHPLDDGSAVLLHRSVEQTAEQLGRDGGHYRNIFELMTRHWSKLSPQLLSSPLAFPKHPLLMAGFGMKAMKSARAFVEQNFLTTAAKALFAGCAAHSVLPMEWMGSAAYGLVLMTAAHAGGWPVAKGGSQKLADALAAHLRTLGGTIELGRHIRSLDELPAAKVILCDVAPRNLATIAGSRLPPAYVKKLMHYAHGPGAFKIDYALSQPVPWKCADVGRAGTIHLGGTFDDIADAEQFPWDGRCAPRPYVLAVQASRFDPTRAPEGKQTFWAYAHVPHGSTADVTERIEAQLERFAPGFRDCVLARKVTTAADFAAWNPNLIGGDIAGGASTFWQTFARPVLSRNPYRTPAKGLYLCSASTPPGGGVHGMCGYHAARAALREF